MAQCAQQVVGFIALKLKYRDVKGLHQLSYPPQLPHQLLRGLGTVRLVLVEKLVAEGRPLHVEGDGVVAGLQFVDYLEQHLGEAVNSPDHLAALAQG
ncbi:hypothetical protein ES708_33883 [subsurface metagenome]